MRNISKRFPGVLANDHVSFDVEEGEIHALIGENGAGKTTLMNILYGLYQADEGCIFLHNHEVEIDRPGKAIDFGIGMVHQHFMLVQRFTVAENMALGLRSSKGILLETEIVAQRIEELSEQYGLSVDPWAMVWQLPVGVQQRVEILKALYRGTELLILDEPTAILTPQEADDLFAILRSLVDEGHSIIFISHKLKEVLAVSDRITVLRHGRVEGTLKTEEVSIPQLARMMVGRDVQFRVEKEPVQNNDVILSVRNLSCYDDRGQKALKGISFELHCGEILGIAGVEGNGQGELADTLSGLRPSTSGQVMLGTQDLSQATPDEAIDAGLSYVPADRKHVGSIGKFTLAENAILKAHDRPPFAQRHLLRRMAVATYASNLVSEYDIRAPGIGVEARTLSGGNLQKLIVAREVSRCTKVLIAMQPTRGLDLATIEFVRRQLLELRQRGVGILLISTELDEILALSDRIAVLYEGEIMDVIRSEAADREQLGLLMAGMR